MKILKRLFIKHFFVNSVNKQISSGRVIKINFLHDKEHWQCIKFIEYKKLLVMIIRYICELINNNKNMNQKLKRIRQVLVALILIAALIGISSCEKYSFTPTVISVVDTLHFQADIQPIFNAHCLTCHGAIKAPDLRDGKSYLALTKGGYVNPPGETSKLYLKITGAEHAPRSTDADKQKILIWINQGALNN